MLRELMVKIELERIDIQKEITVAVLLDSGATELVMSSEFVKKQEFKLKKIERPIYVRNINGSFNKEGSIEYTVEVNIYYQGHRERMEIDVIEGQKWSIILEMLWFTCHNSEMDWKTREIKMMRCSEKCGKQQRPKQKKLGWEKQKEKEKKEERKKRKKTKKRKNNGNKESNRRIGNMGRGGKIRKIRRGG